MNKQIVCGLLLLVVSNTSLSAGRPADDEPKCKENGNQLELNACAFDEFTASDKQMNAVYREILKKYADEPLFIEKLKIAQRLWLQLCGAETEARFPVAPNENPREVWGSDEPMDVQLYMAELTRERIKHLQVWLDGLPEVDNLAGSVHMRTK
jgi:uncharacterized protein YecT (DUF1311 family)